MTRNRVAIAAAVVALALAIYFARDASSPAPIAGDHHDDVTGVDSRTTLVATREQPRALHGPTEPYPELGTNGVTRPLTRQHVDLLEPNRRHETFRPTDADDGTSFLFTADRYFAFGDDIVTSTLEVKNAKAVTITAALAATGDPAAKPVPISYVETGGVFVAQFSPASLHLQQQTEIGMYIEFDPGPGTRQRAHYNLQYTPASGAPASFTGVFSDSIVEGSLVIHTGLDVTLPGHYIIDCNLYDANNAPVGWTHWKGDLAAGGAGADLSFFGKVLVDANAKGPFHIGQLRGARFDPGHVPDLAQIRPYDGSYATKAYATTDFSDAEYDSPDKQHMLQFLSEQQAKGVHLGAAAHGQAGAAGDDH
jgi:hypothetical protein